MSLHPSIWKNHRLSVGTRFVHDCRDVFHISKLCRRCAVFEDKEQNTLKDARPFVKWKRMINNAMLFLAQASSSGPKTVYWSKSVMLACWGISFVDIVIPKMWTTITVGQLLHLVYTQVSRKRQEGSTLAELTPPFRSSSRASFLF